MWPGAPRYGQGVPGVLRPSRPLSLQGAPSRAPVPKVSLGHVRLFLVLCLSERVILVKEEGEKGHKMGFGQGNDRKGSPPRSGFG